MKSPTLNTATAITLFRLLCVPIFIGVLIRHRQIALVEPASPMLDTYRYAALAVFLIATLSDALDGFIARRWHQRTLLGTWLDPLADKLLLTAAVILLSMQLGLPFQMPFWFPLIVISRDVLLLLGTIVIFMLRGHVEVRPTFTGKLTTTLQMTLALAVLARLPAWFLNSFLFPAAIATLVSCVQYVWHGLRQLSDVKLPRA